MIIIEQGLFKKLISTRKVVPVWAEYSLFSIKNKDELSITNSLPDLGHCEM